ncbi:MAG TPA: dihydrodipicolinate synthase family protein, partial [Bryobacteraceae bacterium]|nr:dihydrodipicolinate synthase family protein [Bryobacteraceae bacterium]
MFTGCGTALVTPFRKDLSLDEETLRRLVRRQIEAGIDFLVPCGTTGENPTLSRAEHLRVVEITLEEAYHGAERVVTRGDKKRTIRIPRGVKDGKKIKITGEGYAGYAGGIPGDLYLVINVRPHPQFERREDDLYTDLRIDLFTAVLGG